MAVVVAGNSILDDYPIEKYSLDSELFQYVPPAFPWCWKRDGEKDGGSYNRTVFYRPRFSYDQSEGGVVLHDVEFFYRHEGPQEIIKALAEPLTQSRNLNDFGIQFRVEETTDVAKLFIQHGNLSFRSLQAIAAWSQERPKEIIPQGNFPTPVTNASDFKMDSFDNIIVYAGSGVSYESGLPTLAEIHEYFRVDSMDDGTFTFGLDDNLPQELVKDPMAFFKEGFQFYIDSAKAKPSTFHEVVAQSLKSDQSAVASVLTDNLDCIFEKTGIVPKRVRTILSHQDGINFNSLPDLENVQSFKNSALLVVGIAADRRGIIQAARKEGMKILCVNPYHDVSPFAQNLSYLEPQDSWYKGTAQDFTNKMTQNRKVTPEKVVPTSSQRPAFN